MKKLQRTRIFAREILSKYSKWIALAATLIISGSFTVKDWANEQARQFSESLKSERQFTELRAVSNQIRREIEEKSPGAQSEYKSCIRGNVSLRKFYDLAEIEDLKDSDPLIAKYWRLQNGLSDKCNILSAEQRELDQVTTAQDKSLRNETIKQIEATCDEIAQDANALSLDYGKHLYRKGESLKKEAFVLTYVSYLSLGIGLWLAFYAQLLARSTDPPDLHL